MFGPFTIAGAPRFGDAINGPGQHTKRFVRTLSIPCETRTCPFAFPPDVETYSLQDRLIFNDQPLSFIVDCPTGSICPPGTWPRVITYPPGTFVLPDPVNPGFPYFISLQGCQSVVTRSLPATATPAQVLAAAQEVIQAVAAQQAECDAIGEPPPPNPIPQFVNVETYASFPCEECEVIDYDGILPWYITIDRDNDRFVLAAGLISADSLVSANTQAQDFLNGFVDASVADGKVTCLACTITTASPLPDATVGVVYSQGLTAIDTFEATDWSVISGTLPDGLTLNSASGNIGGTPTTEETQTFTVKATSGEQCCEKEFTIEVVAVVCAPLTMTFTGLSGVIAVGDDVTLPSAEYNPAANGYEATNSFDGIPKIAVMDIHWGEAQLFGWLASAICDPLVSGANAGAITAFNTAIDKTLYVPVLDAGISAIDILAFGASGVAMGDCLVVTTFECPGISDLNSIVWGAPVLNEQGNGVASMSVSGPTFDFDLLNPNDSGDDAGVEVDGTFTCNGVGIAGKLTLTVTNYIPHPTLDFPQFSVLINSSDGGSWGLSSAGESWFTGNGVYVFAVALGCAPGSLISINILSETVNDGSLNQQTITVNGVFAPW